MHERDRGTGTVLVTDAGRGSALAFIRSLGRRGYRIVAADSDPLSLGFRSRYAADTLLYPAPEWSPRGFVEAVLRAAHERSIDLVIPVTDAALLPLSAARHEFDGECKVALPDATTLAVAADKRETLALAERSGVPVPRTRLARTIEEALVHAEELGWPIVLKPQTSRVYRAEAGVEAFTVCYAQNASDLAERMRSFVGRCSVLLQEYCDGTGAGVELLLHEGRLLAAFQHHRLREIPTSGGVSSFRESVPLDPLLLDYSLRLLGELRWTGLAMVEFKLSAAGPKLMEINGRVWGSMPLAVHAGVDFPRRLVELYLNGPPPAGEPPQLHYATGVRVRNLELDLMWIVSVLMGRRRYPFLRMPGRGQAVAALLGLLNPAGKFDIQSLGDPRPGLAEIPRIVRKFRSKLRAERVP